MRWYGLALLLCVRLLCSGEIPAEWHVALDRISADSLRGHVSFLASDLLEGRDTPSRGLDIAAEYIAAQFRGAGLEPAGGDGYLQTANWTLRKPNPAGAEVTFYFGGQIIRVAPADMVADSSAGFEVREAEPYKQDLERPEDLKPGSLATKAVVTSIAGRATEREDWEPGNSPAYRRFLRAMRDLKPALVIVADPGGGLAQRLARPKLIDPEGGQEEELPPVLVVTDPTVAERIALAKPGPANFRVSAVCGDPVLEPVALHNVVAVLRGSDPELQQTAVIVSAHYDHVGVAASGEGDRIFNGANDDASGTAAVIGIGSALAGLKRHPKRSIVFLAFFGEERGMLGSGYYVRHPVFPLGKTVADINVEQVGRSDSSEGPRRRNASVTGFDYSTVSSLLEEAGKVTGIDVYKDNKNSNIYFRQSDNIRFAERGVPAHSVTTAFLYPDYHGPGDHWDKLDYGNMAAVTRMIALATLLIADSPEPPHWNRNNPDARHYAEAGR